MNGPTEETGAGEVERLAARLRELAQELRDPELAPERAEVLAREAADLVGRAGNVIERTLRESAADE